MAGCRIVRIADSMLGSNEQATIAIRVVAECGQRNAMIEMDDSSMTQSAG